MDRSVENSEGEDEIENKENKENGILDRISDNGDLDEDEISDFDEVLSELKNIKEISANKPIEEKAKEDLNKSSEEVIDTTK